MTKTVTRYTQPVVQTQPGPEFKVAEVELFADPKGKWVRYDDIKHLLADEPKAPMCWCGHPISGHSKGGLCDTCECEGPYEKSKAVCKHGNGPLCPECAAENRTPPLTIEEACARLPEGDKLLAKINQPWTPCACGYSMPPGVAKCVKCGAELRTNEQ